MLQEVAPGTVDRGSCSEVVVEHEITAEQNELI